MKQKVKVEEVEGEGLLGLLEKRVLIMTAGYFYEGVLVGVNDTFVKLQDPHIVYEAGAWDEPTYTDPQKLHQDTWYVQLGLVESFGLSKND